MKEYAFLGPLSISAMGPVEDNLRWKKSVALFVYLVRAPAGACSRDRLIETIWPQSKTAELGRQSLREYLRILRRGLGDEVIVAEGEQVRFVPGHVRLDIDAFEEWRHAEYWKRCATLVRGEFLEGFHLPGANDFDIWLTNERLEWRHRCVDVLERAGAAELDLGETDRALEFALRALALAADSEPAVRLAMTSLALAGHHDAALEHFERFRKHIAEIDAVPSDEMQQLAEGVRRHGLSRPRRDPVPSATASKRRAPLCGRDLELRRLVEVRDQCVERRVATVIIIEGDPGTGRTRLAEELIGRAELRGEATSSIRSVQADRGTPWSGAVGLLAELANAPGAPGVDPATVAACCRWSPAWGERFARPEGNANEVTPGAALVQVVTACADEHPVLLCVDDAQWCDDETLRHLDVLLRDAEALPVMLLMTVAIAHGRDAIDEIHSRIGREVLGETVRLGPLSPEGLGDLVSWAFPDAGEEQHDRILRRLRADSGGIPLMAVALVDAIAGGMEVADVDIWPARLRTLEDTMPVDLPDSVVGAIRVGFRLLSKPAQEVLRVMATMGGRLASEIIAQAGGLEPSETYRALDELEWERWVEVEARGYTFVARIMREVVLRDMVTEGQRQRIKENAR